MEENPALKRLLALANLLGLGVIIYLIRTDYRIIPENGFFSIKIWPLLAILWLVAPRSLPFLWLYSIPAGFWTWVKYIFFGCIIVPRMTWGFVILSYFPPQDKTLGWIVMVLGFILDANENRYVMNPEKTVELNQIN